MRPPLKIFLLMSPVVIEGNNFYNLCMAPAPAPASCIAVSLYRCIAVSLFSSGLWYNGNVIVTTYVGHMLATLTHWFKNFFASKFA